MLNKRLTKMNQFGDILYIGDFAKGTYRGMGDYCDESLDIKAIEEMAKKLFYFEETFEDLLENFGQKGN